MKKLLKQSLILVMVCLSTWAVAQNRQSMNSPEAIKARVERMSESLKLKPAQKAELTKIFSEQGSAMASATPEQRAEMRTEMHKKINAVLTSDQQKKMAEMRQQGRGDKTQKSGKTNLKKESKRGR